MRQTRKVIVIGSVCALLVIAVIVGGLVWHDHSHKKQLADAQETAGSHTIPLDQSSSDSSSGGLSVSGQAGSLGQLGDSSGNSQSQGASSTSSSNSDVNPASFSQYNKYQSSQNALFGDIQVGSGAVLAAGQKASIYYKVWLTNGTLVDQSPVSSSGQPQPFSFTLGAHQVILGLEEGVAGMKIGGKRLVIVPPAVGYGSQGQGSIPANAVLVFEVQLLSAQ